jgi:hypothetical protein
VYNVYLISSNIEGVTCYKIGHTKRNPQLRIREMKTGNASELELVATFYSKWGTQIESKLHKLFSHKKISGEWFKLNDSDVNSFEKICEQSHEVLELVSNSNTWFQNTKIYKKFSQGL